MGDVTLGEEASVWFHASLRGDAEEITIGPRTNIQEGCILHADPGYPTAIGVGVTVGKVHPPSLLILGAPARVARELTTEEVAGNRASPARYVERAAAFSKAGSTQ